MVSDIDGDVAEVEEMEEKVKDFWKNPENIVRLLDFLFLGREEGNEIPS